MTYMENWWMNKSRYFDKYQLLIGITAVASMFIATVLFIVMVVTGTKVYDESGALVGITYNNVLQTIFAIFFLIQLTAIVWFVTRTITYKLRIKEEDTI